MGDSAAKGAGKALTNAVVPTHKVWNPKASQIQISQRQVMESARARNMVPERGKQALMRQQQTARELEVTPG